MKKQNLKVKQIVILCLVLFSVLLSQTVLAWEDKNQHKSNEFSGMAYKNTVILTKYIKDEHGNATDTVLPGAVFRLYRKNGEQILGDLITNKQGQIVVDNLKIGEYYFEEVRLPRGYEFDREILPSGGLGDYITKYPFTVEKGQENQTINIRAYNKLLDADLKVTKKVKNKDGSKISDAQKDLQFEFRIIFGDGGTYKYFDQSGDEKELTSGDTFFLKHNESIYFKELPYGLSYQIEELYKGNYDVFAENSVGHIAEEAIEALFVNTISKKVYLEFDKIVENENGLDLSPEALEELEDIYFDFTVEFFEYNEDGEKEEVLWPFHYIITDEDGEEGKEIAVSFGQNIKLKHRQKVSFVDLKPGVIYKIQEVVPIGTNYIPETDKIEGQVQEIPGNQPDRYLFTFVNLIEAEEIGVGNLKIEKQVVGNKSEEHEDDEFTFEVILSKPNPDDLTEYILDEAIYHYRLNDGPLTALREEKDVKNMIKMKDGDSIVIEDIPSDREYIVLESAEAGYEQVVREFTGSISKDKTKTLVFINKIIEEETSSLTLKKIVENSKSKNSFIIRLELDGEVEEYELKHNESVTIEDIPLGTEYRVTEEDYQDEGFMTHIDHAQGIIKKKNEDVIITNSYQEPEMIKIKGEKFWNLAANPDKKLPKKIEVRLYDEKTLIASQEVFKDGNDQWLYEFEVPKYNQEGKKIKYRIDEKEIAGYDKKIEKFNITNTLRQPASIDLQVHKNIKGDQPKKDETFYFVLSAKYKEPLPKQKTVKIKGEGSAFFGTLEFKEAGNYHYYVHEKNMNVEGYRFDKRIYEVIISVKEESNRLFIDHLEIKDKRSGEAYDSMVFVNTYKKPVDKKPPYKPGPEKPGKPSKPMKPGKVPDTSATRTIAPWVVIIAISLFVLWYLLKRFLGKEDRDESR